MKAKVVTEVVAVVVTILLVKLCARIKHVTLTDLKVVKITDRFCWVNWCDFQLHS